MSMLTMMAIVVWDMSVSLTAWAAAPDVMNFTYAAGPSASQTGVGVSCSTQNMGPDGGSTRFEYIWFTDPNSH